MIIDKLLTFSSGQALTATAASDSYVDQLAAGSPAANDEMYLVVRCGTLLDSSGEAAVLKVALETDSDSGFATALVEVMSVTIAEANIAANSILWAAKLPRGLKRYIRVKYTVTGENFTSGTIDAFVAAQPHQS